MDAQEQERVSTLSYAGSCPKCHYVFPPIWESASSYFSEGYVACRECHTHADLWDVVLGRALVLPAIPTSLVSLGATETHFMHEITANKYHEIHLTTLGVPVDATVLQVGYTPQGGSGGAVFPIELHGNVPHRRITDNVLRLLGRPMVSGDGVAGSACPVAIWVVWAHQQPDEGWQYIISAFEAFINGHYDRIIVPAQSAVEITLMPVLREILGRHASADHVKGFMGDKLTFGNAVNVLLPFVCGQAGLPKLPEKVRGSLNKLRKLRNEIVHSGKSGEKIDGRHAAEGLCAAVFGFEYMRYVKPQLIAWLK